MVFEIHRAIEKLYGKNIRDGDLDEEYAYSM